MYKKDYIVEDPAPFRAEDSSYHGDMEGVRIANEIFFNKIMVLKTNPELDIPLTDTQLQQIINNPSYGSLINILEDGLSRDAEKEKGMKK